MKVLSKSQKTFIGLKNTTRQNIEDYTRQTTYNGLISHITFTLTSKKEL